MPDTAAIDVEATRRFIMRAATSCVFREKFERNGFAENIERYIGTRVMRSQQKEALGTIMNCETCLGGMKHVHDHLHDFEVLADDCPLLHPFTVPHEFYFRSALGLLLVAAALALFAPFDIWTLDRGGITVTATIVLLVGLITLWRSGRERI